MLRAQAGVRPAGGGDTRRHSRPVLAKLAVLVQKRKNVMADVRHAAMLAQSVRRARCANPYAAEVWNVPGNDSRGVVERGRSYKRRCGIVNEIWWKKRFFSRILNVIPVFRELYHESAYSRNDP